MPSKRCMSPVHHRTTTMTIRAVCLFLVAIAGCSQATGPELLPTMPLAVGNQWIYSIEGGALDTFEIVGQVSNNGETWYIGNDTVHYCNRNDGLWARHGNHAQH